MSKQTALCGLALAAATILGLAIGVGREIGEYIVYIYLLD